MVKPPRRLTQPVVATAFVAGSFFFAAGFFLARAFFIAAAAAAEALTRLPEAPIWWAVVAASGVVVATGAWLIRRSVPKILAEQFPSQTHQTRT